MTPLAQRLQADLPQQANCWWLAVSGGLDSMCLLHLVKQVQQNLCSNCPHIRVIHVHHGLQAQAGEWRLLVERQAQDYGFFCHSENVQIDPYAQRQQGLEAAARNARYQVFESLLGSDDVLLLAQHADDQAETVLLRLLRGAGVSGLGAMPKQRALGAGQLLRPLLSVSRQDLESYAAQHELQWLDDPSNLDEHYRRNFLRHKVMPLLKQRWPGVLQRMQTTSAVMQESQALLQEVAQQDYGRLLAAATGKVVELQKTLPVPALLDLSAARRHNLLRWWLQELGDLPPDYEAMLQIDEQVLAAAIDGQPELYLAHGLLRRSQGQLYWLNAAARQQIKSIDLDPKSATIVWSDAMAQQVSIGLQNGSLQRVVNGLRLQLGDELRVSLRQGGERCQPRGRQHSQSLKKLLQEYQVPAWQRSQLPLFWVNGELAMVADLWVCQGFAVEPESLGWAWSADACLDASQQDQD